MSKSSYELVVRLVPPLVVGALSALVLFAEEASLLASPVTESTDSVLLAAILPAAWMSALTLGALFGLQFGVVLPIMQRLTGRVGLQLLAAVAFALLASQLFAALFFAPEVDTWVEVSAVGLLLFGLPVLALALLTVITQRLARGGLTAVGADGGSCSTSVDTST